MQFFKVTVQPVSPNRMYSISRGPSPPAVLASEQKLESLVFDAGDVSNEHGLIAFLVGKANAPFSFGD